MAKRNKKNTSKNVKVIERLEFPGGIIVDSKGKGKMKGDNIRITKEPSVFTSKMANNTTVVKLGKKELSCKRSENGLRIV
jgi:hypothetical protein